MGDVGRAVTGIGKDTRKATPTPVPSSTAALSAGMEEAIIAGMRQDQAFSAESQAAFREDRPFVRRLLEEDRAMRDEAFRTEQRFSTEDRANRDVTVAMLERMLARPALGEPSVGTRETREPVLDTLIAQIGEALRTGGVEAQAPIISRAVESSKVATSNALRDLDERLGSTGLAGTPYGERTRAGTLQAGELATANVPTDLAKFMLSLGAQILPGVESARTTAEINRGTLSANREAIENTRVGDIVRALVGLRSGVALAPSPQQLLGFAASQAPAGPMLSLGPTGASLVASGTQRGIAGARIAADRDIAEWQAIASIYSAAISAAGCWVALAIYGPSREFVLARYWIVEAWQGCVADITRLIYRKVGRHVAKSKMLCRLLKPLFDIAVKRGEQAWAS